MDISLSQAVAVLISFFLIRDLVFWISGKARSRK